MWRLPDLLSMPRQAFIAVARRESFSFSVARNRSERSPQFFFWSWYWRQLLLKRLRPTIPFAQITSTRWLVPIGPTASARTISDEIFTAGSCMAQEFRSRWESPQRFSAPCSGDLLGSFLATSADGWI